MKQPSFSLETRLVLRLSLVFAGFFIISGLYIFWHYRAGNELSPVEGLLRDFHRLQKEISIDVQGLAHRGSSDREIDFALRDQGGKILLAEGKIASHLAPLEYTEQWNSIVSWQAAPERADAKIVSLRVPMQYGNRLYEMTIAQLVTPEQSGIDTFLYEWVDEFLPASVPLFLLLITALIFTLRAGLRPLSAILRYAKVIGPGQIGIRLPVTGLPRELAGFVEAVNDAFDRLERGFRAQQDFLADAAHELRTPLAILGAHLDTLPNQAEAENLRADIERMTRLVEQLLLVARMEALSVRSDEITDLSDIALEIAQSMAPLAARQRRRLALLGGDSPVLVRGNRDALYQAVRNLVENALRFTAEDSEVEIIVDPQGKITIADRGPGIPEKDRDQLFQRFWQSDRRKGSGAGLGLTIARRIALAHRGTLSIADNPGGGASFTLKLPLPA